MPQPSVDVGYDLAGWSPHGPALLLGDAARHLQPQATGWEVFLAKSTHNSCSVLERAVLAEQMIDQQFVLHADNGSLFKGATLLEKLHHLVTAIHAVDVKN